MRALLVKIQNLVRRGKVARPGASPVFSCNGVSVPGAEYREPQGLHFGLPANAQGVTVAPNADPAAAMSVCYQGAVPSDAPAAGEGGLHYLGAWKVYVSADGKLHLGDKMPSDFVALASKTDDFIAFVDAVFAAWTAVPNDGGAALKAAYSTQKLSTYPIGFGTVGSTTVKVTP